MFTQAEIEYIQKQLARGLNNDAIKNKLIDAGWDEGDIKDGFKEVEKISKSSAKVEPVGQAVSVEPVQTQMPDMSIDSSVPVAIDAVEPVSIEIGAPVAVNSIMPEMQKKSSSSLLLIISIILLFVLAGGGFVFYKYVYLPSTIKTPEVVPTPEFPTSTTIDELTDEIPPLPNIDEAPSANLDIGDGVVVEPEPSLEPETNQDLEP